MDVSDTLATFTFDKDVEDQALDPSNWVLNLDPSGTEEAANAVVIPPNQVEVEFGVSIAGLSIAYVASPPDVVGTNGLDVVAFDWPL